MQPRSCNQVAKFRRNISASSWSYGVMVSTLDFESNDPSSSLGKTWIVFFGPYFFRFRPRACGHHSIFTYRGFGHNTTGGLGHRGKFRGFIAVSFRRNATGFRPQGHLRPPAHPKIARSLGNRRGRRQAAADDERQRLQKYACKRQNLAYKTPPFARF